MKKTFKFPFSVAEISANHNGSLRNAKRLIKIAKNKGFEAVKLQTFKPETMTLNSKKKYFQIKEGLWKGSNLWKLYEKAQTPYIWHKELFDFAKKIGITCFSTPFDETAVDFLEKLNCPFYKVASFEMTDLTLIKRISLTKKPLIVSTGIADIDEIDFVYKFIKKCGIKDFAFLYCVSSYPAKIEDFNLNNIKLLKKKYSCPIGFSDHSKDNTIAFSAVVAGAEILEKHIALRNQKGLDYDFSIKEDEMKNFVKTINKARSLLGSKYFNRSKSEKKNKKFRRSIFVVENIKKGEKFAKKNLKKVRPGYGISPIYYDKLISRRSPINLKKNNPLKREILKKLKIKVFKSIV